MLSKIHHQLPVVLVIGVVAGSASFVSAGLPSSLSFEKPQLSISLRDGYYDSLLDSFEPTLTWKHSLTVGGGDDGDDGLVPSCDVDLGIETLLYPTTNIKTLPKSIWGKLTTRIGKVWDVSGRIETTPIQTSIQCQIDNVELDFSTRISASKINTGKSANNGGNGHVHGTEMSLDCIEAIKGITMGAFGNNKHHFTVNPRYVFSGHASTAGSTSDIVFGYKTNDNLTTLQVVAARHNQEVTIQHQHKNTNVRIIADTSGGGSTSSKPSIEVTASHQLNLQNSITPTISTEDGISVAYERKFGINNHNTFTSTINTSTRTLSMEYKDHGWTANIHLPFVAGGDDSFIQGATVNIKRDIVLF